MAHARTVLSGALCALALVAVGLFGPSGAAVALLAVPLPTLVVGGVAGVYHAAASSLAASGVLGGVLGWPAGAAFLALGGIPAVAAVLLLRRAWRLEVVVAGALVAMVLGALAIGLAFAPPLATWPAALADAWRASFEAALAMYRDLGMSPEQLAELETQREQLAQAALQLLPALVVIGGAVLWLGNLRVSARWAGWPQLHALCRWRLPDLLVWALIASGFALFAPHPAVAAVAANVFAIVIACYFAQGLAIVSYFFQQYGLPRGLRAATYLVIVFQQIAVALVIALGVFDLWGDFRHLTARPADAAVGSDSD